MADAERTERARDLRLTDSRARWEVWELLRAHRMGGLKFRRQHPIGPFFADFACVARKLMIEVDGEHHALSRHDPPLLASPPANAPVKVLTRAERDMRRAKVGVRPLECRPGATLQ